MHVNCSIGITAYNEADNIGKLLERLLHQELNSVTFTEIIVVASGCTDDTEVIVLDWAAKDSRIRLVSQERREGKASAINAFLKVAKEPVVVLCSADLLPETDAIEKLVTPFQDPEMGMTCAHPVPVNNRDEFLGFVVHMMWGLHHHINMAGGFKAGELVAFRPVFERIPNLTAVDEACVEPIIRAQGFKMRYVPDAIVYNKGPEHIEDFLRQRRRIFAGHMELRRDLGYSVSTMSGGDVLKQFIRHLDWRPRQLAWSIAGAALEAYGRYLGRRDFKADRNHAVWEIATTTKNLEVTR